MMRKASGPPRANNQRSRKTRKAGPELSRGFAAAVDQFENALKLGGGNTCDRYILSAARDERVQESFLRRISEGDYFAGAYCPAGPAIPEEARVIFEFRCLPPKICLLPNLFLVILNVFTGRVLRVIDPFFFGRDEASVEEAAGEPTAEVSAAAAHHPGVAAHHPSLAPHHPALAAHHPSLALHHPSLAAHHPSLAPHHPALAAHHPSLALHHPALAAHHPSLALHHPSLAVHHPSLALHHPSLATHHPGVAAHHPSLAGQHPGLAAHHHPGLATLDPADDQ